MKYIKKLYIFLFVSLAFLAGCQTDSRQQILHMDKSQVSLRAVQTRTFDTNKKIETVRIVLSTLQDLGFVVDKADEKLGMVSGTKLSGSTMRITVLVRHESGNRMFVRANAQHDLVAVSDPKPYQQFFSALEKSMFLLEHKVD
jgi:hypothetical protein